MLYQYVDDEWYQVLKRELPSNYPTGNEYAILALSNDGQTIGCSKGFGYSDWQIIKITNPNTLL